MTASCKEQKNSPDTDIFTGKEFAKDEDKKAVTMDDIKAYIATLPEEKQAEIMSQLQQAQQMGMTEQQIADAFAKQMSTESEATYDGNMTLLGVASLDEPSMISIYPKDFDAKEKIEEIISTYNDKVKADGNENLKIEYTDIVGLMMTSVVNDNRRNKRYPYRLCCDLACRIIYNDRHHHLHFRA